jgi:hypothetical protein
VLARPLTTLRDAPLSPHWCISESHLLSVSIRITTVHPIHPSNTITRYSTMTVAATQNSLRGAKSLAQLPNLPDLQESSSAPSSPQYAHYNRSTSNLRDGALDSPTIPTPPVRHSPRPRSTTIDAVESQEKTIVVEPPSSPAEESFSPEYRRAIHVPERTRYVVD